MSFPKPGDRVGAILSGEGNKVLFLGYGVYDGDFHPGCGPMGASREHLHEVMKKVGSDIKPEEIDRIYDDYTNPRITLDDGRVVWGMQCWWGKEESVKKSLEGKEVVLVDVDGYPIEKKQQ